MNKQIFALAVLFMVFVSFQVAQPAAAVKVVDSGTKYINSGQSGPMKVIWKTYASSDSTKTYDAWYVKDNGKWSGKWIISWHDVNVIQKIAPNAIKVKEYTDNELSPGTTITYHKTPVTALQYYWRVERSKWLN